MEQEKIEAQEIFDALNWVDTIPDLMMPLRGVSIELILERLRNNPLLKSYVNQKVIDFMIRHREGQKKMEFSEEEGVKIQQYLNAFRNFNSKYILPTVSQEFHVVGFDGGVIIKLIQQPNGKNFDLFDGRSNSLTDAFKQVSIDIKDYFDENSLVKYETAIRNDELQSGTLRLYGSTEVILIKENNPAFWTTENAKNDVEKIFNHQKELFKEIKSRKKIETTPKL